MKYVVAELTGAKLDYAVCIAGEYWRHAHALFPTMTLDPTFQGCFLLAGSDGGEERCMLRPNNPMRQDPQEFRPSRWFEHGDFVIEREMIGTDPGRNGKWFASTWWDSWTGRFEWEHPNPLRCSGETRLIAAMRVFVLSKMGPTMELP